MALVGCDVLVESSILYFIYLQVYLRWVGYINTFTSCIYNHPIVVYLYCREPVHILMINSEIYHSVPSLHLFTNKEQKQTGRKKKNCSKITKYLMFLNDKFSASTQNAMKSYKKHGILDKK